MSDDGRASSVLELLLRLGVADDEAWRYVAPIIDWFDGVSVGLAEAMLPNLSTRFGVERVAAEEACAELNDALDAMRMTADEVQAKQRGRVQAGVWAQAAAAVVGAIDVEHLTRQAEFSRRTFGPGLRTRGVIDHITKEFDEILADPEVIDEWVDVIILGFDGALRTGAAPAKVIAAVKAKQAKNEARVWPDFRDFGEDEAIEHGRGIA